MRLRWFATKEQNIMRISSPLMRRFQIPIALAGSMNDMLRSLFLMLAYHVLWKPVGARHLTALFPGAFSNAALGPSYWEARNIFCITKAMLLKGLFEPHACGHVTLHIPHPRPIIMEAL